MGRKSKKQSLMGYWVDDASTTTCQVCGNTFSFTRRRHHCRVCGRVVCAECSKSRIKLSTSRSGQWKRQCNICVANQSAARYEEQKRLHEEGVLKKPSEESKKVEEPRPERTRRAQPSVSKEQIQKSNKLLGEFEFDGKWELKLEFLQVDLHYSKQEKVVSGMRISAYKPGAAKRTSITRGNSSLSDDGHMVEEDSSITIGMDLFTQPGNYFKGTVPSFAQFGKEGKVTGALQKSLGRITLQVQVSSGGVTTQFNFTGYATEKHVLEGKFTGCEISRTAGTVSGKFTMVKAGTTPASSSDKAEAKEQAAPEPSTEKPGDQKVREPEEGTESTLTSGSHHSTTEDPVPQDVLSSGGPEVPEKVEASG